VEKVASEIAGANKKTFSEKYAKATRQPMHFLVYDKNNSGCLHNFELMTKKNGGLFDHYSKKKMEGVQPDLYITPDKGIEPIVAFLEWINISKEICILEPCAGTHAITNFLKSKGYYNVLERDLYELPEKHDFLVEDIPNEVQLIITNPPFSDKLKFLMKCYNSGRPFALLSQLSTLGNRGTGTLMMERGVRVIYVCPKLNFKNRDGENFGIPDVAWFIGNFGEEICSKGHEIKFDVWFCPLRKSLKDLNQSGEVNEDEQPSNDEEEDEEDDADEDESLED
jgi:hypothetical protein